MTAEPEESFDLASFPQSRISFKGIKPPAVDVVDSFGLDPPGVMKAGLLANARIGMVRLCGEARLRLSPESRFDSATMVGKQAAGKRVDPYGDDAASLQDELGDDERLGRARAGLGCVRRFDRLALTARAETATDGSVAAGLNPALRLGPDPRSGGVRMSAEKLASRGTGLVRV